MAVFFYFWLRGWPHDSWFRYFPLLFIFFLFRDFYRKMNDPHILEVDSLSKTVLLRDRKMIEYNDVLWIEISEARSGGYNYDYLKFITSSEGYEKIIRTKNTFVYKDRKARELATALSEFMHKELKKSRYWLS